MTRRIPDDQPFVARPSPLKRGVVLGVVALLVSIATGCLFGAAFAGDPSNSTGGDAVFIFGAVGCMFVLFAAIFGLQIWLVTSGGPVMACGPDGMWIKTRPTRGQAIWLPWAGIERISKRRWGIEKMLVVKARDPRATANLGAFTAVDSSMLKLVYGSGFTATLNFADRKEAEMLAAVAHFSAGRTPITA